MTLVEIVNWVTKYGTKHDKERFRVVFKEVERLKAEIRHLKKQLQELSALDLIPNHEKEKRVQELVEKTRTEIIQQRWQGQTLGERLFEMKKKGKIESEEWNKTLKWNRLSLETALKLIEDEEKKKAPKT